MTQRTSSTAAKHTGAPPEADANTKKYVQAYIDGQLFGIDVEHIEDVLLPQPCTIIPQAAPEIKGMINLRGRIVTIISVRRSLGLSDADDSISSRNIVINHDGDLYSLEVDGVAEILDISDTEIRRTPDNVHDRWKELALGVYSANNTLMVMLDLEKLFRMLSPSA